MTPRDPKVVWEPDGKGWRAVRARVPARARRARSERVPRPPLHPAHAERVEGYSARELREGARGLLDPILRRLVVELEELVEASAKVALMEVAPGVPLGLLILGARAALTTSDARRGKRRRRRRR